jgi:hypothetical protein
LTKSEHVRPPGDTASELTYEDLRDRVQRIHAGPVGKSLRLRHEALHIVLNKTQDSHAAFTMLLDERPRHIQGLKTLEVRRSKREDAGTYFLSLVNLSDATHRFTAFLHALWEQLQTITHPQSALDIINSALTSWSRAFSQEPGQMSLQEMLGLVGELTVLQELVSRRGTVTEDEAVSWWKGPHGEAHDFAVPSGPVIEVKASTSRIDEVHIANEHQLDSSLRPLLLCRVRVDHSREATAGASTLPQLYDQVRTAIRSDTARSMLDEAVALVGFCADDPALDHTYFTVRGTDVFEVSEGFPRLVPADLPLGVSHVAYTLSATALGPYRTTIEHLRGGDA